VYVELPGMEPYKKTYYADPGLPEEASAAFDDISHEMKCWRQLLELALQDLLFSHKRSAF